MVKSASFPKSEGIFIFTFLEDINVQIYTSWQLTDWREAELTTER